MKNEENPEELRLVIVFDMQVEKRTDENYAALSHDDVDTHAHFRLAWRFRDNAWFMNGCGKFLPAGKKAMARAGRMMKDCSSTWQVISFILR